MGKKIVNSTPQNATFEQWLEQQPKGKRHSLGQIRDRLVGLFRDPQRDDIRWQYKVGQYVLQIFPVDDQRRGQGCMEMLGDLVEPGRDRAKKSIISNLYAWRSMAVRCSPEEVKDFAAKVRAGVLRPQHVAYLVSVDAENNSTPRAKFLRECVKHSWSANQLRREIQADRKCLTSFGGRPTQPRTKSSTALAARDIIVRARGWVACHQQYFEGRGAPLARSQRKCSPRLRRELELALDGLQEVSESVAKARKILSKILSRLPEKCQSQRYSPRKKRDYDEQQWGGFPDFS